MKRNVKLVLKVCLAIGLIIALTAASLFDNSLMDSNVQITDHAVLYIDNGIAHPLIDGDIITDTKGKMFDNNIVVMLTPDEHTITGMVADINFGKSATTVTTSGFMEITHNFIAGHFYFIQFVKNGNNVSLKITDETDPVSAWSDEAEQKRAEKRIEEAKTHLKKATYPKKNLYR